MRRALCAAAFALTVLTAMLTFSPAQATPIVPHGPGGTWVYDWHDGFNGTALDLANWCPTWFHGSDQNNVLTYASNVTEANGYVTLTLAGSNSGASINTNHSDCGIAGHNIKVGDFVEAQVKFAGNTSTGTLYNWPAFWTDGQSWPTDGENDIAEVLGGDLTANYHSPCCGPREYTGTGNYANAWHIFGMYRKATSVDLYWDGVKVKTYTTSDSGKPQYIIFNIGNGGVLQFGSAGAMRVNYVRQWTAS